MISTRSVLLELTAEDLTSFGMTSVGHRRKLLAAIAALRPGSESTVPLLQQGGTGGSLRYCPACTRGRATSAHRHVRRPRRLDRARVAARSGGMASSCGPIRVSRTQLRASKAMSPSTWATAFSLISAIHKPTRTKPNVPCGPPSRLSRRCAAMEPPAGRHAGRTDRDRQGPGGRGRAVGGRCGPRANGGRRHTKPRRPAADPGRARSRGDRRSPAS